MSSSWPFCSDPCSGAITDHQLDNNHGQKSSNSNQNNHALEHRACCLPESCLQNRKHKRGQLTSKASTWMAPSHLAAISAEPGHLNTLTAEFLIGCFLGAENAFCSSISWKLTWVRFCPDGVPPFILVLSRRTTPALHSPPLGIAAQAKAATLFRGAPSLLPLQFVFLSALFGRSHCKAA